MMMMMMMMKKKKKKKKKKRGIHYTATSGFELVIVCVYPTPFLAEEIDRPKQTA
jgi:hypothetical protein